MADSTPSRRGVPREGHRTTTEKGSVGIRDQLPLALSFDPRTADEHIQVVYRALQRAVGSFETKQGAFADELGKPYGEVSMRLRRAENRGELQRAYLDYVGILGLRQVARERFLVELGQAWGMRVERAVELTPEQKLRVVARELPDHRKRELEAIHGLPIGDLDR